MSNDSLVCAFTPASPTRPQDYAPPAGHDTRPAEPNRSFFRGVAVGLAVMIPVWAWIILSIL